MCGQSVHERLKKMGIILRPKEFTEEEKQLILNTYKKGFSSGDGILNSLCNTLGKSKANISRFAHKLGLSNAKRKDSKPSIEARTARTKKWYKENPHPRGMKGKKHSQETREKFSRIGQERWNNYSTKQKQEMLEKYYKGRIAKWGGSGVTPANRRNCSWKAGWREIGDKRHYFRSRWEANYARYLQWKKEHKEIMDWKYEVDTFWFEKIRRGVRSYKPDFKIFPVEGEPYYDEVKGWMDQRSKTTLRRMAKYYPEITVNIIDKKVINGLKNYGYIIKGWE